MQHVFIAKYPNSVLFWDPDEKIFIFLFAAGVLSLLDETEPQLKVFALEKLNKIVDVFWAEISEAIDKMWVNFVVVLYVFWKLYKLYIL